MSLASRASPAAHPSKREPMIDLRFPSDQDRSPSQLPQSRACGVMASGRAPGCTLRRAGTRDGARALATAVAEIDLLAVDADLRGQGVGSALLNRLILRGREEHANQRIGKALADDEKSGS
ncbi:GNAT family N-acetyltransferase [Streptomyces sp. E11-3]|uniref:GNAT family N-acetyltransferase n=1 Tax=Streptomyces sp. E11-3 TaxID=3110112 RepID=UPI00397EFFF3